MSAPPTAALAKFQEQWPDLYERGVALWETPAGVNELAWAVGNAVAAVQALADAGHCVLGGDVWLHASDRPRPANDNWYFQPTGDQTADVAASREAAIRFIESYKPGDGTEVLFTVVWR